jgi:hypothetical protein
MASFPSLSVLALCALAALPAAAQTRTYAFNSLDGVKLIKVKAAPVTYQGRKALQVTPASEAAAPGDRGEDRLAIVTPADFGDGVIEAEITGKPGAGAMEAARGFVGVAFRVAADASRFECFYLRPTNGRADDQVRRRAHARRPCRVHCAAP